jgi:hypothetical protein
MMIRILDPTFSIPDSVSEKAFRNMIRVVHLGSGTDPDPDFFLPIPIPDAGVKKAPDPDPEHWYEFLL